VSHVRSGRAKAQGARQLEVRRRVRPLRRWSPWLYAAAAYNLAWGAAAAAAPAALGGALGLRAGERALLPGIGLFVAIYAPAYFWAARHPYRHPHLIAVAMLGKVLGPAGFLWAASTGRLPFSLGWTILANDLVWWPALGLYLRDCARLRGGWSVLLSGG
jgi:small multidrug resistance pump